MATKATTAATKSSPEKSPEADLIKKLETDSETIKSQYNQYAQRVKESDEIIADLSDRLLRQKEARQVFLSVCARLEVEYTDIVNKLNELKKEK